MSRVDSFLFFELENLFGMLVSFQRLDMLSKMTNYSTVDQLHKNSSSELFFYRRVGWAWRTSQVA